MADTAFPSSERLLAELDWARRLARALVGDAHADDLAQEALRVALERPPRLRPGASLRAWLRGVLGNLALKQREGSARRAFHEERAARAEAVEVEVDAQERVLLHRRLADAVLALDEPYRSAIVLRYFDGRSPREIAEVQRISYDAARQRLSRALAMLRARLDGECGREQWLVACLALPSLASERAGWWLASGGWLVGGKTLLGAFAIVALAVVSWLWWSAQTPAIGTPPRTAASAPDEGDVASSSPARDRNADEGPVDREAALESQAPTVAPVRAIDRDRDLHGVVMDAERRPIAGARVIVVHHAFAELEVLDLDPAQRASSRVHIAEQETDDAGEFAIPLETGRSYDLLVEAPGFAPGSASHCHAGERVEIALAAGATLSGRVLRTADDSPVAGATVELRYSRKLALKRTADAVYVVTDAEGRYRFDDLPSGLRMFGVFPRADARSGWIEVELVPGSTIEHDVRVGSGNVLRGRVVDSDTRTPIEGAVVGEGWEMRRSVRTDALGEFEFPGFATSCFYEIAVLAKGYGRLDQTVQALNAEASGSVEVALIRGRTLRGRVIDGNGAPVADAYVAAPAVEIDGFGPAQQLDWPATRTRDDGSYELADVRRDMQHLLFVVKAGYGVVSYDVDDRDVIDDVLTMPDVVLHAGAIVRGVVVDQVGEPHVARVVHLHGRNRDGSVWNDGNRSLASRYVTDRSTRTDDLGRFAFADVAIGDYELSAPLQNAEGTVTRRVAIDSSEPVTDVELVVPRGLSITGRVVGPDGEGMHAWLVLVARDDASGSLVRQSTELDGTFAIRGLEAGVYSGVAYPTYPASFVASERSVKATIEHVSAGTTDVVVRLPRGALLGGRVLEADGSPAVGVTVDVGPDSSDDQQAITSADGTFAIWLAENSGPYELRATGRVRQEGALQRVESFLPERMPSVSDVAPGDGLQHEIRLR